MKSTIISVWLVFICVLSVSAQINSGVSIISGKVTLPFSAKTINLFNVVDGSKVLYTTTNIAKDGSYAFALNNPEEGLYYISFAKDAVNGRNYHRFYIKQGDNLVINLSGDGTSTTLVKGSPENITLMKWQELSAKVYKTGTNFSGDTSTYWTFFPELSRLLAKVTAVKKTVRTPNNKFNIFLQRLIDADVQFSSLSMLYTPRTKHPQQSEIPNYYSQTFKPNMFCDAFLAKDGDGSRFLGFYMLYLYMNHDSATKASYINHQYVDICNDTLKGIYLTSTLQRYKSYESLENAMAPVKNYFVTTNMQQQYFDALKAVSTFKAGTPGYNFNYPDTAGKNFSLRKELSGKVVYVDLWATWCGPCKGEIPYLQKMEEEFKDENIAFVSISIDELKDKGKWKDFVRGQNLGGLQLYAGGWGSDIATFYGVHAIPRFMLFDQKGNIVSVDAPRPSKPELKDLIIKTLRKE